MVAAATAMRAVAEMPLADGATPPAAVGAAAGCASANAGVGAARPGAPQWASGHAMMPPARAAAASGRAMMPPARGEGATPPCVRVAVRAIRHGAGETGNVTRCAPAAAMTAGHRPVAGAVTLPGAAKLPGAATPPAAYATMPPLPCTAMPPGAAMHPCAPASAGSATAPSGAASARIKLIIITLPLTTADPLNHPHNLRCRPHWLHALTLTG